MLAKSKCLFELLEGPDLYTECWVSPFLPRRGKLLFGSYAKSGKALHVNEKVLLKNGTWVAILDIKPGDELASVDGEPSIVLGKEWHVHRRLFEVIFSDGTRSICADDHLWETRCDAWEKTAEASTILTTLEAQEWLAHPKAAHTELYIPQFKGEFGDNLDLPIDPYILGALIGDGSFVGGSITITSADEFIVNKFKEYFGEDNIRARKEHNKAKPYQYGIVTNGVLQQKLKNLGLLNHKSEYKFIPEIYLKTTRENRLALLQGLMDTDGTAGLKYGNLEYSTSSPRLAQDVIYLIRSLGYGCTSVSRIPKFKDRHGKTKNGLRAYRIKIHGPGQDCFQLPRKKARTIGSFKFYRKKFAKITEIDPGPAICIQVSHPRGLFITNDFIVTHNSMLMMSLARALVTGENAFDSPLFSVHEPASVLMFERELGEEGLQKRMRKIMAGSPPPRKQMRYISRDPEFNFSTKDGYERIGNEVAEFKPEVLIIDPVGKMHHEDENDAKDMGVLLDKFDKLLSLGAQQSMSLIMSHHFGKPPRGKAAEGFDYLDPYNFRGSSKWFDDVDGMITIHRTSNLNTPHRAWRLQARFQVRHDEEPPEMFFTVNRDGDLRVKFERMVDAEPQQTPHISLNTSRRTTDPRSRD